MPSPISTAFTAWIAHHSLREQPVELAVPVHVAPETDRHPVREHLDHATERVALLCGGLHLGDHRLFGVVVDAAHRRGVDPLQVIGLGSQRCGQPCPTESDDVAQHGDRRARRASALASDPAADAGSSLAGGGTLEHVPRVRETILLHPRQVRVPGTRRGKRLRRRSRQRATSPLPTSATRCWRSRSRRASRASGRGGCRRGG